MPKVPRGTAPALLAGGVAALLFASPLRQLWLLPGAGWLAPFAVWAAAIALSAALGRKA